MTARPGTRVTLCVARLIGAALVFAVAPQGDAQSLLPRFERSDCQVNGDWARDVRRECGWLVVPESRDRATGNTVRLAVEVFRAAESSGAPPLVLLHGGPGGPGGIRTYSAGIARSPVPRRRDVIIYDQRGAGLSEPKLCAEYDRIADLANSLREGAEKRRKLNEARRACIAELDAKGINRLAYNTQASVADLIDLRRTLGYTLWDIHGFSYGARLTQAAMVRDRDAIRSVVLSSPMALSFSTQAEQPLSTQRAFEQVFAACDLQPACREKFPAVDRDFYTVYAELTRSPFPVAVVRQDKRTDTVWVDGNRLVADLRNRMATRTGLATVPLLLHELHTGDRLRAAREMVGDGSAPGDRALREIMNCYDSYGAASRKTLDSVNAVVRPPFRRARLDCEEWLPRFGDVSSRTPVRSDIPTLLLTGRFDDRTPTAHARRIASTLSRAYFVEFPDEGHDTRPSGCHAGIVMRFFDDPTRKPDTSCVTTIPPVQFATTWEPSKVP